MTAKAGKIDRVGTTTTGPDKDFAGSGIEGQKGATEGQAALDQAALDQSELDQAEEPEPEAERTIVTGEDVIATMRANGVKI